MDTFFTTIKKWIVNFLHIQLFLSLVSLPVLTAWGLPFSVVTLLGNLFFTPLLTAFLLCCSCIFFLELFHIPNSICINVLEYITQLWLWILSYSSSSWMTALSAKFLWITIVTAFIGYLLLCIADHISLMTKNSLLLSLLCTPFIIQYYIKNNHHYRIIHKKKDCLCISKNKDLTLYDNGALNQAHRPEQWVDYTLLPTLIKQYGMPQSITFFIAQPTIRTLQSLLRLQKHFFIKKIIFLKPQYSLENNQKNTILLKKLIQKSIIQTKINI